MKPLALKTTLAIVAIILLTISLFAYKFNRAKDSQGPKGCTQEAKICPDGSTVGRVGEDCQFAPCPQVAAGTMTEKEARTIAEKSCIKGGEALGVGMYNDNSKTWWFDANLNAMREGCNPACVVSEGTKTAEINWRCTGLKAPLR